MKRISPLIFWQFYLLAGAGGLLLAQEPPATPQQPQSITLPVGTEIAISTIDRIDSKTADKNKEYAASLDDPVIVDGVEVVPAPTDPSPTAIAKALADPSGPAFVLRGSVEAEGRSYTFRLEMVDGKSAAVLANREDRCEICTEAEALETANTAASTLKSRVPRRTFA